MGQDSIQFVSYTQFEASPELQKEYGGDYTKFLTAYTSSMEKLKKNSVLDLAKQGFTMPTRLNIDPNSIWREQHAKYMANAEQKYEESQAAQKAAAQAKTNFEKVQTETNQLLKAYKANLEKQGQSTDGVTIQNLGITESGKYLTAQNAAQDADSAAWLAILSARDAAFQHWVG